MTPIPPEPTADIAFAEQKTFDHSEKSRAYRRAQVLGARKIIKKLQKGMSAEDVSRKTGVSLEAVKHLEGIIKIQSSAVPRAETETFIDGKEV